MFEYCVVADVLHKSLYSITLRKENPCPEY